MKSHQTPGWAVVGLGIILGAGCGEADRGPGTGGHAHASVHGGVAVELGEHQFHLDVLLDPAAGELRAWVMDAHVEDFVRVPLPAFEVAVTAAGQTRTVAMAAQANPATGETVGNTSHFAGQAEWLKGLGRFEGRVPRIEVRGATFRDVGFAYPSAP